MPTRLLRYRDLKERGYVRNRVTLRRWIEREGFPAGRLIAANTRIWEEHELEAWVASRPSELKKAPAERPKPSRRKRAAEA